MMRLSILVTAFALLLPLTGGAYADEVVSAKVPVGRKVSLFSSGQIDPVTCKTIDTVNYRPDIVKHPVHGSLSAGLEDRPFRSISGSSPCNGKPFLANVLYYQPNKGFKGEDEFVLRKTTLAHFREMTTEVTVKLKVE